MAKTARPLPDTYHGLVDAETRYRRRYLDLLVNEDAAGTSSAAARSSRRFAATWTMPASSRWRPSLQPRYGGAFAEPFVTRSNELDADLYLRIATELYLKRLIVGGLEKVYELGKDFQRRHLLQAPAGVHDVGVVEAYADYKDTMERIENLLAAVAQETTGTTKAAFRGYEVELAPPWQRLKLVDALEELGLWTRDEAESRPAWRSAWRGHAADRSWGQLLDHALSHFVEPELIQPTILYDYPVELSPSRGARTTTPPSRSGSSTSPPAWSSGTRTPS